MRHPGHRGSCLPPPRRACPRRHWRRPAGQEGHAPLCQVAQVRAHPAAAARAEPAPQGAGCGACAGRDVRARVRVWVRARQPSQPWLQLRAQRSWLISGQHGSGQHRGAERRRTYTQERGGGRDGSDAVWDGAPFSAGPGCSWHGQRQAARRATLGFTAAGGWQWRREQQRHVRLAQASAGQTLHARLGDRPRQPGSTQPARPLPAAAMACPAHAPRAAPLRRAPACAGAAGAQPLHAHPGQEHGRVPVQAAAQVPPRGQGACGWWGLWLAGAACAGRRCVCVCVCVCAPARQRRTGSRLGACRRARAAVPAAHMLPPAPAPPRARRRPRRSGCSRRRRRARRGRRLRRRSPWWSSTASTT